MAFTLSKATRTLLVITSVLLVGDLIVVGLVGTGAIDPARFTVGDAERPVVVSSTTFLDDLILRVAGDKVNRVLLVGPGGDPHTYQPTTRDQVAIERAALVVLNGWGLEPGIEEMVESVGKPAHRVLHAAQGMEPHYEDDARTVPDPHMWLSIPRAKVYVANIRDALERVDPANAALYRANANATERELDVLDAHIRRILATIPADNRSLITTHDAFRYFGNEYGIRVVDTLWGVSTEVDYSPQDRAQLVQYLRQNRVPAVFVESSVARVEEFVGAACEAEARVGGTLFSDSLGLPGSGGHTYFTMMLKNAEILVTGLTGGGEDACTWKP